jgi:hypothetical protein
MDQLTKRCYDGLTTAIALILRKPQPNLKNAAQLMIADCTGFSICCSGNTFMNMYTNRLKKILFPCRDISFLLRAIMKMRIICAILPKLLFQQGPIRFT